MKDPFQIVRYKVDKQQFEVLVKPETVQKYREGKLGLSNVLFADSIFKNHSKAEKAKEAELQSAFNTSNVEECIKVILEKGEAHLTTAERKAKMDAKRLEIINYIHKYYIDPKSKTPHPVTRIESVLDSLKMRIEPDESAERQAQDIIKKMVEVIPLKKSEVEGMLQVPHAHLGVATGVVHKWCTVLRENYDSKGCVYTVSLVPGDFDTFITDLTNVTKGDFTFDLGTDHPASVSAASGSSGKSTKGKRK